MGANDNPVGTGAYLYQSHDQSRMVWQKRTTGGRSRPSASIPSDIVDIVNGSNNVALGLVLQGGLDLCNNFLPGVATLVKGGYGVQTYYPTPAVHALGQHGLVGHEPPEEPMDDVAFRKALAYSINVRHRQRAYTAIVAAANPTGLLPTWDKYVDKAVVKELGFTYDPGPAKQILADAGYKDVDDDGFVETDGSTIALEIIVPNGWTDWMESIKVISKSAQAVGINVQPDFPDYSGAHGRHPERRLRPGHRQRPAAQQHPLDVLPLGLRQPVNDVPRRELRPLRQPEGLGPGPAAGPDPGRRRGGHEGHHLAAPDASSSPTCPSCRSGTTACGRRSATRSGPTGPSDGNHYLPTTWRGYWQMGGIRMLDALEIPSRPAEQDLARAPPSA